MRKGRAARVVPFTVRGPCDCAVCAEREQLHIAAAFEPDLTVRMVAMSFLGAMDAVHEGRLGSLVIENCFD